MSVTYEVPVQSMGNDVMSLYDSLEVLCGSILDVDRNIQSVAVLNKRGRVNEKISKPDFEEQFPDYLNELFCMHHVLQISMGREFDERYGQIEYHISNRAGLTTLTFPVDERVVLVTAGKDTSPITLARTIICMINEQRKQV